jgi:regulation of enolase protein 1 (concanavalin A-like superfamily)
MEIREFFRKHLMKVFIAFIGLQLAIFGFVQSRNHKPQANSDRVDVIEGRVAKASPLTNDLDKDENDTVRLSTISQPNHGKVTQKRNIIFYTPNKGYTGKDSISYSITDGRKESKPAWIVFEVLKNEAPATQQDNAVVYAGSTTVIYALDNDADKERDSLTIAETTKPLFGEASVSENKLVYTASNSAATQDSFYYTASDGKNLSKKTAVKINIQKKSDVCYPWLSMDIGATSKPGKIICHSNSMMIQASGTDIWNNADGFYFTYQMINGDFEISAKVESLEGPHEWTKSGLMFRENLDAGSKNVFIGLTLKNGITTQARPSPSESSENGERISDLKAPYWIKLSREGDSIKVAVSPEGITWKKMEGGILPFSENAYIGFAVTSHDIKGICKTTISNYKLKGKTATFRK